MRCWPGCSAAAVLGFLLMPAVAPPATAADWKDQYAEVNGVKLHYVEQGKGPLILFLHGFPEFWYEWKDLLPEFAKTHHAVALDMRGYNLSAKPEKVEAYAVPVIVEDIRALGEKLGAKRFVLAGHDWGGVIAWAFAAAHPELLEKLIIVNAPHPTVFARELANNPSQQKASSYFNLFNSPAAEATLGANNFQALASLMQSWGTDADRKAYLENWNRGITGGLNYYRAANLRAPVAGATPSGEASPLLSRPMLISTPTLVIWGEKDTALLTGNLDGLDQYVKQLQIVRVPDGTHWVIHEKPQFVIESIRKFLDPIDKRAFGVLPNYRTADGSLPFQPIGAKHKMTIAVKDSFDGPLYILGAFFAGIYQWEDQNPSFGQGMKGYAHRYVTSTADQIMGNMFAEGVAPSLLHQDPRYFRRGTGPVKSRLGYTLSRIFVCKSDHGNWTFNTSEVLGNAAGVAISNAYYPDTRTVRDNTIKLLAQLGTDAASQVAKEFWPDIKRKLAGHRHHESASWGGPSSPEAARPVVKQ